MKLIDMAMKPEKKEAGKSDCCCCAGPCGCDEGKPRYPWGLQLRMEKEQLDLLGITAMPKVGETMTLTCAVKVTSFSETEMEGGEAERCVTLQVVAMGMEGKKGIDMGEAAKAIYTNTEGM